MQSQPFTLSPGTLLHGGMYRINRFISAGGFGCTYEAVHIGLNGRVAIKEFFMSDICNRDGATGHVSVGTLSKVEMFDKLRGKFIREAQSVFALSHPGIVHVSDVFEENGTAYFVMDYIDGCSLADLVKKQGPLDERTALGYIHQVCAALDYVHANARLHLDIKPGNIMVDRNGRAILIDFGASKQYDSGTGENLSTLLGYTPGFAPPEQMSADVREFLPATDIYALGATLYNLLTGDAPTTANLRFAGKTVAPLPATVSATTRRAVEAALQLNKTERPQSVVKFANMLFRGAEPQSAPKPQPQPAPKLADATKPLDGPVSVSPRPWYRRYGVAIAVAAVAVIGGVIALLRGGGEDDPVIIDPDTVAVEEVAVLVDSALPAVDAAAFAQAAQAPAEPAREQAISNIEVKEIDTRTKLQKFCGSFTNTSPNAGYGGVNYIYELVLDPLNSKARIVEDGVVNITNSKGYCGTMMRWPEYWEVINFSLNKDGKEAIVQMVGGNNNICDVRLVLDDYNNIVMTFVKGNEGPGILLDENGNYSRSIEFRRDN